MVTTKMVIDQIKLIQELEAQRNEMSARHQIEKIQREIDANYEYLNEWASEVIEIMPKPEVKQATVSVYYESGYRWSVHCSDQEQYCTEDYSNLRKVDAVAIAKKIAKQIGAALNIQTMTRTEAKQIIRDRWDHAKAIGQDTLQYR